MMSASKTIVAICAVWSLLAVQARLSPTVQQLYDGHRWFELRDAIAGQTAPPLLYAGAVASAFNDVDKAESLLKRAVRGATTVDVATDARDALANLYARVGRARDVIDVLDEAIPAAPARADFRNARTLFESFHASPNQTARVRGGHRFRCSVAASGLSVPVTVNGRAVEWLIDSAFSMSAANESEARMLGVRVQGATASAGDFAGGTTTTRAAVVERMTIGDAELRNVQLLVFPDSQPPWSERPAGKRGTIGIPVLTALQSIHWTKDGRCEVGANRASASSEAPNLAFDGETPIVRVLFNGRPLDFVLDTGNQGGTQLWQRFADDFPNVMQQGRSGRRHVQQIGGSTEQPIVIIPEIQLRVGGFDARLQPAHVFSKPVGDAFQHGNLGFDVLSQADVAIDFRSMRVSLTSHRP